jgi:hypothetical protein
MNWLTFDVKAFHARRPATAALIDAALRTAIAMLIVFGCLVPTL